MPKATVFRSDDPLVRLQTIRRKFDRTGGKVAPSLRTYEVEFERRGKDDPDDPDTEMWDVYKTKDVKGCKNATDAAIKALKGHRHVPKKGESKFVFLVVKPSKKTTASSFDQTRDFGEFYAFRSVRDGQWAVHRGKPNDRDNIEAGHDDDVG